LHSVSRWKHFSAVYTEREAEMASTAASAWPDAAEDSIPPFGCAVSVIAGIGIRIDDVATGFPKTKGSQRRQRLELFARYFAKFLQRIDAGPAHDQLIELADSLVGCKIGCNGLMHDFVGAFDGLGR
jgi:hypothetical protein